MTSERPNPPRKASRTPPASSDAVRNTMRANRPRNTRPEWAIRRELFARGLRYRIHRRPVPSVRAEADILFTRERVAVFVDGCFWHSCPDHSVLPKANREWWRAKLAATVARDRANADALERAGWRVVRVWEHETPASAADRIVAHLRSRGDNVTWVSEKPREDCLSDR